MRYDMPKVNIEQLSGVDREYAERITRPDGRLRATKPDTDPETNYVWRMVAFYVSPNPRHHHMPIVADLELPGSFDERNRLRRYLMDIVDRIVDAVDKTQWYGVHRWARALGAY